MEMKNIISYYVKSGLASFWIFCNKCLVQSVFIYRILLSQLNPFWFRINFVILLSVFGFLVLRIFHGGTEKGVGNMDLFFVSVSSVTASGLSTVEFEKFTNTQLVIITILMVLGSEMFISLLDIHLLRIKLGKLERKRSEVHSIDSAEISKEEEIEMGVIQRRYTEYSNAGEMGMKICLDKDCKHNSFGVLYLLILGYLFFTILAGYLSILIYINFFQSAKDVLRKKNISKHTFSIFMAVSSFTNCGLTPTNENMIVFLKNSGLLLLMVPLILSGNTLLPVFLRFIVWSLKKFIPRKELNVLFDDPEGIGFGNLFPKKDTLYLGFTALGFLTVQFIVFSSMEWNSDAFQDLNPYQKIAASLFQSVNTRHAGENIVDLSTVYQAVTVLFLFMMYLPSYTSFRPNEDQEPKRENGKKNKRPNKFLLSPPSYLIIVIIIICIVERERMRKDPLNFSLLNIAVEVVSAYGNVGYSTGYSCERLLKADGGCKSSSASFVGTWSRGGKITLLFVMIFGKLKKFYLNSGKAWKLKA